MKYLKVFTDFIDDLEEYGDAERGRLFSAMLEYARSGTEPGFRGNERFIWKSVKASIDRERDTYERMAERARNVALTRSTSTRHRDDIVRHRDDIVQENNDIVQDKEKKYIPPISPKGDSEAFVAFWNAYPRHVAKENARKAWAKLKADDELLKTILGALEAQKASDQWTKDGGRFIPHPATWLNARRWEDEVHTEQAQEPDTHKPKWADNWGDDW